MAEEELEARIRIAMPPLQRLGDILLTQNVEFDAGAVATSLAQLHRNEQLRVPVADPAVAGPDQTRQGLHGTSYAAALRIIQEGFVGRVCHGRISRITGRQEELVYCHTKRTGDKAWQYCNDTRPLAPSLPLLHVCIECAIPAGYAHWKNKGGQTAWLPDQVTPLAFVFKAIEGPPRLTVAVAADAEAANAKDAAEVQETQVFSGDPDEEVQEKQVSQVEDTDYTQNTEDISLPSTRSWLPEGEVASQPSIVTIRGPSPMSGEPGVYSDSEDTSDGDDSEEKPSTNPLYEFTVPLPISQEDVRNELVTHIMDNPESRSQPFPLWIQQVIPPRGASLTTEPVIRPMNCDLSAVFFLNRKKYRVRLAAESLTVTERLTTPWDFQLTDLGRRDRSRSRARTAGSSESE